MDPLCLIQTTLPLLSPLTISNLRPSWQGGLSLMGTLHKMDNSLIFSQCSSTASSFDSVTYVSNHLQIGDLKRLCGFTIPSAQHEVWSSVCSGTFGNRIIEALNPNLRTVMFYSWGFQGKPGVPPLVCS